jgi:MFS family permease
MALINEPDKAQRSALATWALLGLLTMGVLISFIDRTSIGAAIADKDFVAHFGLNKVQSGWLSSLFFWSYGIAQLPMGWLVDRYGSKWPYALFFAGWCVITALTGLVDMLMALFAARLLVGVAEAVVIPASYRWIRHNFDETNSGFAVGLFAMGNKFGPAIGTPVSAWLIVHFGWHSVFFAMATAGSVWLLGWITLAPNDLPPKEVRTALKRSGTGLTIGAALRNPVILGSMITNFCYGYFTFYCMTWMPSYLVETRHLSLQTSGVFTFFSFAGIALMAAFGGWAADRIIVRGGDPVVVRKAFMIAGFAGGSTVIFGTFTTSLEMALFWNVASLTLLGLTTANNLTLCRLTLIPKPAIGLVTGIQQVATSLSGGVAASLSGWLLNVTGGYGAPMAVIFVLLVIGALATIGLLRPEWAPRLAPVAQGQTSQGIG